MVENMGSEQNVLIRNLAHVSSPDLLLGGAQSLYSRLHFIVGQRTFNLGWAFHFS